MGQVDTQSQETTIKRCKLVEDRVDIGNKKEILDEVKLNIGIGVTD